MNGTNKFVSGSVCSNSYHSSALYNVVKADIFHIIECTEQSSTGNLFFHFHKVIEKIIDALLVRPCLSMKT